MFEYLKNFEPVFMLLLGWSMGLLSPTVIEKIRRRYRRRDLIQAVVDEFVGLQYTMALVAWRLRSRNAEVTDDFLDALLPVFENYTGPDRDEAFIEAMRGSRATPEGQRRAVHELIRKQNQGPALKQYGLPLFVTQLADLAICPLHFQRAVLHIRYHVDLFNQSVPQLQSLFDRTFTDLNSENRAVIIDNLECGYRALGERAEMIVKAIGALKQRYTPHGLLSVPARR